MYFDAQQLGILLNTVLDDEHLFHGLGEQGTDSVFMRSYSSLAIAVFVRHHPKHPFLTAQEINEAHRVLDSFEPALGQILQEISNREIPSSYF
ncbi:MAG: DUF2785 domain-containing protein [Proteobacteria bacterium]|nr:DUF2785 domain-containing protein [Pseudomonadota bacterium]